MTRLGRSAEPCRPLPAPDPDELRERLDAAGLDQVGIQLQLVPEEHVELEASNG